MFIKHTLYARQCAEPGISVLNKADGGPTFLLHQLGPRAKERSHGKLQKHILMISVFPGSSGGHSDVFGANPGRH